MKKRICMGIETEYSVYSKNKNGEAVDEDNMYEYGHNSADRMIGQLTAGNVPLGSRNIPNGEELRRRKVGQFAPNGARFYKDMGAPEISTPECTSPRMATLYDAACRKIVRLSADAVEESLGWKIDLYAKNSDGFGNSYGCHESYSIAPDLFRLLTGLSENSEQKIFASFMLVRQLLTGAGKVGSETENPCAFQISQRADFMKAFSSISTTMDRPLINMRQEPLCNGDLLQRLHVIMGDANVCERPVYLKTGLTSLLLLMLADRKTRQFSLPIFPDSYAMPFWNKEISRDIKLENEYLVAIMREGREIKRTKMSACDILEAYLGPIREYANSIEFENPAETIDFRQAADEGYRMAGLLKKRQWRLLFGNLDWVTKLRLGNSYLHHKGKQWTDCLKDQELMAQLRSYLDMSYARIDNSSIYRKLIEKNKITRLLTDEEIAEASLYPPPGRAEIRMLISSKFKQSILAVDWNHVSLKYTDTDKKEKIIKLVFDLPFGYTDINWHYQIEQAVSVIDMAIRFQAMPYTTVIWP